MKWGYMITIITPGEERPRLFGCKNAKTAWKIYSHWKRKYQWTNKTIIFAKNTRIIDVKFPAVDIKSTKPNIEPLGGAKN